MFRYLLINHVPFAQGPAPGQFYVSRLWIEDLRAECRALRAVGGRLVVAVPLVPDVSSLGAGGFGVERVDLAREGFDCVPLPRYLSLRAFLGVRKRLAAILSAAMREADMIQCGPGGHPLPLGWDAWDVAGRFRKKRIWVMDGGDASRQWELQARAEPKWWKRRARVAFVRYRRRFEFRCVATADLVFAHNHSTPQTFARVWGPHCHVFVRSFVSDEMVLSDADLEARGVRWQDRSRPLRLVVASRLAPIKAVDEVLQALAAARAQGAALLLDIYGDGPERPALEQLTGALALKDAVAFHGAVPYGQAFLRAVQSGDVMVVTNVVPELSRNLLLGMALGLPLVAYRNPAADRLLETSKAARLVPARDVQALAAAFVDLDRRRSELPALARAGRACAAAHTLEACHRARAELAWMEVSSNASAAAG